MANDRPEETDKTESRVATRSAEKMQQLARDGNGDEAQIKDADTARKNETTKSALPEFELTDAPKAAAPENVNKNSKTELPSHDAIAAASKGSIEDASDLVKNFNGTPQEKADLAVKIIHERITTANIAGAALPWTANRIPDSLAGIKAIDALRERPDLFPVDAQSTRRYAEIPWQAGAARCGEHAILLGTMLRQAGVEDVHIVQANNGKGQEHAFVVVGVGEGKDMNDPSKWPKGAYIADSWGGRGVVSDPAKMQEYFSDNRRVVQHWHADGKLTTHPVKPAEAKQK
jgi:hypothetical protein